MQLNPAEIRQHSHQILPGLRIIGIDQLLSESGADQAARHQTDRGVVQRLQLVGLHVQPQLRHDAAQPTQFLTDLLIGRVHPIAVDQRCHLGEGSPITKPVHRLLTTALRQWTDRGQGIIGGLQQACGLNQLRGQRGLAMADVVRQQPIRQAADRLGNGQAAGGRVGHQGNQQVPVARLLIS